MNLSQIGEFGMIERLKSGLETRAGTQVGIGDDCAVLEGLQTPVISVDALVEGVHFRRDWTTPRALGRKAMAVGVSDLASSGARPVAAFVSLCAAPRDEWEWIRALYQGFEDAAREFAFTVAGGDTTKSSGGLVLSITLVGEVLNARRGPILRSGAQVGDWLVVSGELGDAAAGLAILRAQNNEIRGETRDFLLGRHHEPTPRLLWMRRLLEINSDAIRAGMDLSDGLTGDAAHLARKSCVNLEIEADLLPISAPCRAAAAALGLDALEFALSGGEDYELLLAVAPQNAAWLLERARDEGISLAKIGECVAKEGGSETRVEVRQNGVLRAPSRAWTHF